MRYLPGSWTYAKGSGRNTGLEESPSRQNPRIKKPEPLKLSDTNHIFYILIKCQALLQLNPIIWTLGLKRMYKLAWPGLLCGFFQLRATFSKVLFANCLTCNSLHYSNLIKITPTDRYSSTDVALTVPALKNVRCVGLASRMIQVFVQIQNFSELYIQQAASLLSFVNKHLSIYPSGKAQARETLWFPVLENLQAARRYLTLTRLLRRWTFH